MTDETETPAKPTRPVCRSCGSAALIFDASAEWDAEKQEFALVTEYDSCECSDCGYESNYADWVPVG